MSYKILLSLIALCLLVLQYSLVSGYRFPRSDEIDSSESDEDDSSESDEDDSSVSDSSSEEEAGVIGCDPLQETDLVIGLADADITASSFESYAAPFQCRLNGTGFWEPEFSDSEPYLQFRFSTIKTFTAIKTRGENGGAQWVTSYAVAYSTSTDCLSFTRISQNFIGNTDSSTIVTNTFSTPFTAQCIKVLPLASAEGLITMGVGLIGC